MSGERRTLARRGPLVAAFALLAIAVARALLRALARSEGHLAYALDDPYIHMALARNLAAHGVWGVTSHAFTSASSSPLWTLLLAALFRLAGPREWLPFAVELVVAPCVLLIAHAALLRRGVGAVTRLVTMLAIVVATPLPALVFSGLEHLLHLALMLMFAFALAAELDADRPPRGSALAPLAAGLTAVRYEGLFAVAVALLLLLAAGRVRRALATGLAALVPPAAFAAYSLAQGGALLPNSLLLKGHAPHAGGLAALLDALGGHALGQLLHAPHLAVLAALLAGAWLVHRIGSGGRLGAADGLPLWLLGTMALHLQFAATGWFFRYEAYLVGCAIAVLAWMTPALQAALVQRRVVRPAAWMTGFALLALAASPPLLTRALSAYGEIPAACMNIHQQQYQMGRFVREHYRDQGVALNDIGAVTFLADIRCLDLVGLANPDALRLQSAGRYDARAIDSLAVAAGVRVAIVYDKWFANYVPGGVPPAWTRVAVWHFPHVVVTYSDSVSFYAVRPGEVAALAAHLRAFVPGLPAGVTQTAAVGVAP